MTQRFAKLKVLPAYKVVYNAIEREILAGRLRPGDKLPTEMALAEQFGVNRSTVREGIRQLEQNGFARREGGKRLHVSIPQHQDLASRASRAMVMQHVTFRELWQVTMALEPLAAAEAATRGDGDVIAALERNVDETAEVVEAMRGGGTPRARASARSLTELDIAFHALVAKAAANRVLELAREPVSQLFYPTMEAMTPRVPQSGARLLEAHRMILAAIKRGDGDEAGTWMTKHIVDFKRGYVLANLDMDKPVSLPESDNVQEAMAGGRAL